MIRCLTGSQCREARTGVMSDLRGDAVATRASLF